MPAPVTVVPFLKTTCQSVGRRNSFRLLHYKLWNPKNFIYTVKHSKVAQITCLWVRLAAKLKVISKNVSNMTLRQWTRLQNIKKSASYVKNCVIQLWKGSFYRPHLTMVYFTVNVEHRKKLFCFWTDLDEIRCVDVPWVDTCTYQILSRLVKNWLRRTAFNFTT